MHHWFLQALILSAMVRGLARFVDHPQSESQQTIQQPVARPTATVYSLSDYR
jgi:hypothetical protein